MKKIKKIFIANRGEIVQRILRSAHAMQIKVVVVYTHVDAHLNYVSQADQTFLLQSSELSESYLNAALMIKLALQSGADAIHPGYGFLSENSKFAKTCIQNGLNWIGPSPEVIDLMGNKQKAIQLAASLDIPVLNGRFGSPKQLLNELTINDLPLMIKASAGGGGKGMHIVSDLDYLHDALEKTTREAQNLFGSGRIFVEPYVSNARHIEVQVLGDSFGNIIHLLDRECSVQRRYQKIIEEAPAPGLSKQLRESLYNAALKICHYVGYQSAGTIEFIVDKQENFFFLEMNTRIQVEHPVTEEITGVNLIDQQLHIAADKILTIKQNEIKADGHAIECRIYAEDPEHGFMPSPGDIRFIKYPYESGVRIETAITDPQTLASYYDPLIAKVVSKGKDRTEAIELISNALRNTVIDGVKNNAMFLFELIQTTRFTKHEFYTNTIDQLYNELLKASQDRKSSEATTIIAGAYIGYLISQTDAELDSQPSVWTDLGFWRACYLFNIKINRLELTAALSNKKHDSYMFQLNNGTQHQIKEFLSSSTEINCVIDDVKQQIHLLCDLKPNHKRLFHNGFIYDLNELKFKTFKADKVSDSSTRKMHTEINAVLPGKVVRINVNEGSKVSIGETLLVLESMKIENNITSTANGFVSQLNIEEGQQLKQNELLLIIKDI